MESSHRGIVVLITSISILLLGILTQENVITVICLIVGVIVFIIGSAMLISAIRKDDEFHRNAERERAEYWRNH